MYDFNLLDFSIIIFIFPFIVLLKLLNTFIAFFSKIQLSIYSFIIITFNIIIF